MLIYKYQRVNIISLQLLKYGQIYFASPDELNDVQECRPIYYLQGTEEVWRKFVHYLLVNVCIYHDLEPKNDVAVKMLSLKGEIFEATFKKTKKNKTSLSDVCAFILSIISDIGVKKFDPFEIATINKTITHLFNTKLLELKYDFKYISSFSKTATNPTMWGHYGDAEKGFVIIYKLQSDKLCASQPIRSFRRFGFSKHIESTEDLEIKDVKYGANPPKINLFYRLIPHFLYSEEESHYDVPEILRGDITQLQEENIGLVKYKDWRYEKEIRVFFPSITEVPSEFRTLSIIPDQIDGIIFGPEISEKDKQKIINCTYFLRVNSNSQENIFLYQAKHKTDNFELEISPFGKTNLGLLFPDKSIEKWERLSTEEQRYMIETCIKINTSS